MRRYGPVLGAVCVLLIIFVVAASSVSTTDFSGFVSRVGAVFTSGETSPEEEVPQLRPAQVAWNTPEQMKVGESVAIEARATFDAVLGKTLASGITAPGAVGQETTDLSPTVSATLSGPSGVEILPKEAIKQQIRHSKEAVWMWTLEAKKAGKFPIILTLTSLENGQPVGSPFRRTITVGAAPLSDAGDFITRNWKDLYVLFAAPALAALFGAFYAWWKRRRSKKSEEAPASSA